MAGRTAILSVRILGDSKSAVSAMGDVERSGSKMGGALKGIGGAVLGAATIAGGALIGLGVAGVKAAGDLEQSIGAVDSVFKGSADQVHAFADSAATDLGLTANEYNELATIMGTQLKNGGTSMDELAGKTNDLMVLGSDMAAMFGGSTADAVGAISSALKGERDPIERYGVSLKQAGIDARAAELGFQKVGGALSDEAQQAATLSLIMEQTADAHGTFGRETGTFAGQVAILTAQWGNFVAQVGTLLLPLLTSLLTVLTGSIMPALQGFAELVGPQISAAISTVGPMLSELVSGFTTAAGAASPLQAVLEAVMPALTGIGEAVTGFLPTLLAFGQTVLPLIVSAVSQIIPTLMTIAGTVIPAVIGILQSAMPIISNILQAVIPAIVSGIQTLVPVIMQVIPPIVSVVQTILGVLGPAINWLLPLITGVFGGIVTQITGAIQIVTGVLNTVAALLRGDWAGAWRGIQQIVGGVMTMLVGMVQGAMATLKAVTGQTISSIRAFFINGFTTIWQRTVAIFRGIVDAIGNALSWLVSTTRRGIEHIKSSIVNGFNAARDRAVAAFNRLVVGVTGKIRELIGKVRALPGQIKSALGNVGNLLVGAGKDLIRGLINGIGSMGSALRQKAGDIAGGAVDSIKKKLGIASPSKVMFQIGEWTGEGLIKGLDKEQKDANKAMSSLVEVPDVPTFPVPAGAGGGRAGVTEVHVHIDGAFVGDELSLARELQRLIAKRNDLIGVI